MSNYFTLAGFKPAIPAAKQPQTLDHMATGIGSHEFMPHKSRWFKIQVQMLIITQIIHHHTAATQSKLLVSAHIKLVSSGTQLLSLSPPLSLSHTHAHTHIHTHRNMHKAYTLITLFKLRSQLMSQH
jgi:hypothetical protein